MVVRPPATRGVRRLIPGFLRNRLVQVGLAFGAVAIALAYVTDTSDPLATAAVVVGAYHKAWPIPEHEIEVLFDRYNRPFFEFNNQVYR